MKYTPLTIVNRVADGTQFVILAGPDKMMIEDGMIPAYAYQSVADVLDPVYVLPQDAMEDGRFEVAIEGPPTAR